MGLSDGHLQTPTVGEFKLLTRILHLRRLNAAPPAGSFQCVPRLSPKVSWDRLQLTRLPNEDKSSRPPARKDTLLDAEAVSQEVFMGCTIYAASPKALPADEAARDAYYQQPSHCHNLNGNCSQRIAARARSMTEQQEHGEETGLLSTQDLDASKDEDAHGHLRFHLIEELSYEDVKKCYRGSTVSKYNSQYHKLFQCVPKDELLMKVYSCALLRDILLQGRLYISRNWLCFYANLFGKDIKVAIPVVSVRLVKKHKTAGLVPNGLAITTDTGQKYVFVSLLSRDSVYDVLRRICTHLQVNGKSLSLKQYMEEPTLSLDEFPTPDEFPVVDEFPSVLKWRRKPSVVSVSSSLPDLLGNSSSSLSAANTPFKSEQPLEERALQTDRGLLSEPVSELGQMEYQLLKFFTLLIILLILSSCYLAFRVCSLEQQLSFLSNPHLTLRER
ncbi:GRAM domain-containing protein 2A isoform X3 [Vanacampus margaritifer]